MKIQNLTDTNKRIRLTALDSAMANIDDSVGAIAKDGKDVLICLSPQSPGVIGPITHPMALKIVPVTQERAIRAYYANGKESATAADSFFHDKLIDGQYDTFVFSSGEIGPIVLEPSTTTDYPNFTVEGKFPNPAGYISYSDMRSFTDSESMEVIFPEVVIARARDLVDNGQGSHPIITESFHYPGDDDPSNGEPEVTTASELVNKFNNSVFGFYFSTLVEEAWDYTMTIDLGDGTPATVYRAKPVEVRTNRFEPVPVTVYDTNNSFVNQGLFAGLKGRGFIEYTTTGDFDEYEGPDGGGGAYTKFDAVQGLSSIQLSSREGIDAWVTPNGDAHIQLKGEADFFVQFSLLTETDMDLSDRASSTFNFGGMDGFGVHYMKTSIPEHKLFHHRFFATCRVEMAQ